MDISGIKKLKTLVIDELYDNDGNRIYDEFTAKDDFPGVPATIEIFGPDTDEYAKASADMARQQSNNGKRKSKGGEVTVTAEDVKRVRKNSVEFLSKIVAGWTGFYDKKKPLEVNQENAFRLLSVLPSVKTAVNAKLGDETNFFAK